MGLSTISVTKLHAYIFTPSVKAFNIHQKANMLMDTRGRMWSLTETLFFCQSGRKLSINWPAGTRTSPSICCLSQTPKNESLFGFMNQISMHATGKRKAGITKMQGPSHMQKVKVLP
jgi:hypothetical protein